MNGPERFVRYAYPPNSLGLCGPDDVPALLGYGLAGRSDFGLRELIGAFDGAYPYLELIADAAGIADPLDDRVVEAYWVGNRLLSRVPMPGIGRSMTDRFRDRAGRRWDQIAEAVWAGALAHHSFHVFGVYPWAGFLRGGQATEPLSVLDGCRIRWGRVIDTGPSQTQITVNQLEWVNERLSLGVERVENVTSSPFASVEPGDWVSVHWGWVCDRLSARQVVDLRSVTRFHLRLVNEELSVPLITIAD